VIFKPGDPENVLGSMITVPEEFQSLDEAEFKKGGKLFLTTVYVTTPKSKVFGFEILKAWIDGDETVLPRDSVYPKNQPASEIKKQESQEMTSSQENAIFNALSYLGYNVPSRAKIVDVLKQSDAHQSVKEGDLIIEIDGREVDRVEQIVDVVRAKNPGDFISLVIERDGKRISIPKVTLMENSLGAAIGIFLTTTFDFPIDVKIQIKDTGGPSAGLIFSLGVIEKMTEEDFVRGRKIAGTGAISTNGEVGAIGGIESKMIGARREGATIFLAPLDNCGEIRHIPKGLQVIPVKSLKEAISALRSKDPASIKGCQASG
jgi:PDZ domain-containing protein